MHKIILNMSVLSLYKKGFLIISIIEAACIIRETQCKVTPCSSEQSGLRLHLFRVTPQSLTGDFSAQLMV